MRDWAGTQDVSSAILAKRGVWFTNREGETVLHGNVLATTPVDYSCHATSLQMWRPQNPFPYSDRKLDVSISHGNKLEMADVTLDC